MLNIVLVAPEIPYNAGNAGRTCVALGAKLWMVEPLGFKIDDKHVRRAGLDYWQHLNWEVVKNWSAMEEMLEGRQPWLLTKTATTLYTEATFSEGDFLVFGSESRGLPPEIMQKYTDRRLKIPMEPVVRSLNLAVSVGIVAFEARRQCWVRGEG